MYIYISMRQTDKEDNHTNTYNSSSITHEGNVIGGIYIYVYIRVYV
jgi:hypothetical protein